MRHALALLVVLCGLVAALAPAPVVAGDAPVLQTYRKRFTKDAFLSDREDVLHALAETGSRAALDALVWCVAREREFMEASEKEADKLSVKLRPLEEELDELYRKYAEEQAKLGNPNPKTGPRWPVLDKLERARADLQSVEKRIAQDRVLRDLAIDSHGQCVDRLPDPEQEAFRASLTAPKGPLRAKEWAERAAALELLRAARAPWVTDLLLETAANEPDPRALVPALDALGGRDAKLVVPALAAHLADVRWLVRAAALSALERTPSREGIDAIVARAQTEEGRLRDDCLRIVLALTGADIAKTPEALKQWWDAHREAWNGPPPPPSKVPNADEMIRKANAGASKTGFFGIETSSKRLCYVIDISGSMNEKVTKESKESRAEQAKAELIRSIRAMEDGSWFALVLFSSEVQPWKTEMTLADDASRKAAVAFVEQAAVAGATNTYGALELAFTLGEPSKAKPTDPYADAKLDTIILLSDGKPTRGHTVVTDEIRAAVRDWNKRRHVTVHTIAFGNDADFKFLEGLAQDTGGAFVSQ